MLISNRNKFIFFHLPKAAGSSVESVLRKYSHIPSTRLYNYMYDYLGEQPSINLFERHIQPRQLKQKKPDLFSRDYLKFAIVRNTWDWHCSQYHFHRKTKGTIFHEELKDKTFSEYVDWAIQEKNIARANSRQKIYLSDDHGTLLVDRILHFETLNDDFRSVCKDLGLSAELPLKNSSERKKSYHDDFSQGDREKISAAHSEDISFFQFTF